MRKKRSTTKDAAIVGYDEFLARKGFITPTAGITEHGAINPLLFPFQRQLVSWALRKGRAALFADTGLGKGWMTLEWCRLVAEATGGAVLLLAPLAVSQQFAREAEKLGCPLRVVSEAADVAPGVNVTNYHKLHKFDGIDFAGVALDESSILKNLDGSTRGKLVERFQRTRFRLCATATPSPNDHTELAGHSHFLGLMTQAEMLATFFVHDGGSTQDWRLKGHARKSFWDWVASWAITLKRPSDLGFDDAGYDLPPIEYHEHVIPADAHDAKKTGTLFVEAAAGLHDQRKARRASLEKRVAIAAEIANATSDPVAVWCDLNDEGDALESAIDGAVQVAGADDEETKEDRLIAFSEGRVRVMVSKPTLAGFGLNWQHCNRVVFCGVSHSFEQFYQAVRRVYRFKQTRQVHVHVVTSELEGRVLENLKRKQADADLMAREMVRAMRETSMRELGTTQRDTIAYMPGQRRKLPEWLLANVEAEAS